MGMIGGKDAALVRRNFFLSTSGKVKMIPLKDSVE
jgi:hypothetical protein